MSEEKKHDVDYTDPNEEAKVQTGGLADVAIVKGTEDEVPIFLAVWNETEWSKPAGELLEWDHTIWWIGSNNLVGTVGTYDWSVWFTLHQVNDLSISIENH